MPVRWAKNKNGITGLHEILGQDYGIEEPNWGPLYNILGPVARSLVSANRWLRGIKMYRFPWYLTLVSTNHASSNPGQAVKSVCDASYLLVGTLMSKGDVSGSITFHSKCCDVCSSNQRNCKILALWR